MMERLRQERSTPHHYETVLGGEGLRQLVLGGHTASDPAAMFRAQVRRGALRHFSFTEVTANQEYTITRTSSVDGGRPARMVHLLYLRCGRVMIHVPGGPSEFGAGVLAIPGTVSDVHIRVAALSTIVDLSVRSALLGYSPWPGTAALVLQESRTGTVLAELIEALADTACFDDDVAEEHLGHALLGLVRSLLVANWAEPMADRPPA